MCDGLGPQLKHGGGGVMKHGGGVMKHGGGGVMKHGGGGGGGMVWGCFSANGVGILHKVDGTINSDHYIKLLKFCAVPSFKHLHPNGNCVFQQDNASCHTSKKVKKWFEATNIEVMPWPGNSPDANPIDNVWEYIEANIADIHFRNVDGSYEAIKKVWLDISGDYIKKLIDSMKRRIQAIIKTRGGSTRY